LLCLFTKGEAYILIDSTGQKVYGTGQWREEKHGIRARRTRGFAGQQTEVAIGVAVLNRLPGWFCRINDEVVAKIYALTSQYLLGLKI